MNYASSAVGLSKQDYVGETQNGVSPMLQNFSERFQKENARCSELIGLIQDKLHQILDRRTPETKGAGEMPAPHDLATFLSIQYGLMENNNNRIEQLLNHLQEIA